MLGIRSSKNSSVADQSIDLVNVIANVCKNLIVLLDYKWLSFV